MENEIPNLLNDYNQVFFWYNYFKIKIQLEEINRKNSSLLEDTDKEKINLENLQKDLKLIKKNLLGVSFDIQNLKYVVVKNKKDNLQIKKNIVKQVIVIIKFM